MSEHSESNGVVEVDTRVAEGRGTLRERGLATVEYAVGILLILTVVGVMVWSAQQGWFKELVETLFRAIFQLVTRHLVA